MGSRDQLVERAWQRYSAAFDARADFQLRRFASAKMSVRATNGRSVVLLIHTEEVELSLRVYEGAMDLSLATAGCSLEASVGLAEQWLSGDGLAQLQPELGRRAAVQAAPWAQAWSAGLHKLNEWFWNALLETDEAGSEPSAAERAFLCKARSHPVIRTKRPFLLSRSGLRWSRDPRWADWYLLEVQVGSQTQATLCAVSSTSGAPGSNLAAGTHEEVVEELATRIVNADQA